MLYDQGQHANDQDQDPRDVVLRVSCVEKMYEIYEKPRHRLLQYVLGSQRRYYSEFWALRNVSFEVLKGETFGIIGRNGAGKTTLLQCIAGTLTKTGGEIHAQGRMTALLELGSGFNPEFTGRENVYMNGTILGFKRREMSERLESIKEFADIGEFFDRPVKTYSKGMYARLAFSVMANIDPDILIIDEALAVGDAIFRHRCMHRIDQLKERGTTILYVAHDSATVRRLCDRVVWLDKGRMRMIGPSDEVVQAYLEDQFEIVTESQSRNPVLPTSTPAIAEEDATESDEDSFVLVETSLPGGDYRVGDRRVEILGFGVYNGDRKKGTVIEAGGDMYLRLSFVNRSLGEGDAARLQTGWTLKNLRGDDISATHTGTERVQVPTLVDGEQVTVTWKIRLPILQPGSYAITTGVSVLDDTGKACVADRIVNAAVIHISTERLVQGMIRFHADASFRCSFPEGIS